MTFHRVVALLSAALTACSKPTAPPPSYAGPAIAGSIHVKDGVTIVDHAADAFDRAPQFIVDTVPIAVMGGSEVDPAYDLTYARAPLILPGGGYAALMNIGGGHVLIFGPRGEPIRIIGRNGQGPGDFIAPLSMILLGGDTLYVPDPANSRINWLLPDRGFIRTKPLQRGLAPAGLMTLGVLTGGRIVSYSATLRVDPADSVMRPPIPIATSSLDQGDLHIIDNVPGWEMAHITTHYRGRTASQVTPLRLGRTTSFAALDTLIAVASGAQGYAIDLINAAGHLVSRIHVAMTRRPVTPAMREAQMKLETDFNFHTGGEGLVDPDETRREIRENPFADSLPPYSAILATPGHLLWVVDAQAPTDSSWSATAFRVDGAIVGRLHFTGRVAPLTFGDDRVIVRHTDKDGVVSFRVYRLTPPAP